MGSKYVSQATSGYDSGSPPDDGTQVAANLITWSGVKTKLTNVLKTFAEAINTALVSALDLSARAISVNDTAIASDHWKTLQVTGATTITLSSAASMGAGYEVGVFNAGASTVTVTPGLASDTINNLSASVTIPIKGTMIFRTNQALTGYNVVAQSNRADSLTLTFGMLAAGSGGATLYTSNNTHVAPRTGNYLVIAIGGGSGGSGGAGSAAVANRFGDGGRGGGAGQFVVSSVALTLNDNNTVTIGTGGAGGAGGVAGADGTAGTAGTATTFGALVTAATGAAGQAGKQIGTLAAAPVGALVGHTGGGYGGGLGGNAGTDANGNNGGNAVVYGGGGGGGGGTAITAAAVAKNGGAGGNGAAGLCIVIPI